MLCRRNSAFAEYDAAFIQADAEEPPASLCRVALNRLLFPYNLRPENRARYEAYLRAHPIAAYAEPIAAHAAPALRLLAGLLEESDRRAAALACGRAGWGEGAALLLAASAPKPAAIRQSDMISAIWMRCNPLPCRFGLPCDRKEIFPCPARHKPRPNGNKRWHGA